MKWGGLGSLIPIGHVFFLVAGDGGDGSPGPSARLVSCLEMRRIPLIVFLSTTGFS